MKFSNTGFGMPRNIGAAVATSLALIALCACGGAGLGWDDAGKSGSSGGGAAGGGGNSSGSLFAPPTGSDAGTFCLTCATDATVGGGTDAGSTTTTSGPMLQPAIGKTPAADCANCTFPDLGAPACAASAPAIKIVYPNDGVLLPPNLNVLSVQWTPFGVPFTRFEVDFTQSMQSPKTDWRVVTACTNQTTDMQTGGAGTPSAGCELTIDPASWTALVGANRGLGNPITITVRGTTDGTCASSSNAVHMSLTEEDLLGTYYYWKSTVTAGQGVGGFIWAKHFGDLKMAEVNVTPSPQTLNATCNGCHSLSRDGSRMVVYSDDNDSDDEYNDVAGSELDMTPLFAGTPKEFPGGITQGGGGGGGQPPGFTTINPQATSYVTSNGSACTGTGAGGGGGRGGGGGGGCGGGYPAAVPTNGWSLWNATNGAFVGGVPISAAGTRPTMPDWSIDGTSLVYVLPQGEYTTWKQDDAHIYGGSLYTVPYTGNGTFGTPKAILTSAGENNYYPSYSPDTPMSFILFNRVAAAGAGPTCTTGAMPMCANDSFSNPAARLWMMPTPTATTPTPAPVDLQKANGSTAPWSNSYPRWAPFVQNYHGNKLLWVTFSSTRDYGVRVLNHKTGMYQCYPADAAETPGGAHRSTFAAGCQEPQLWMAPITFAEASAPGADPSGVAFWMPYQDITSHNHTAQWTWIPNSVAPPGTAGCTCSMQGGRCGAANSCGCCGNLGLVCTGTGTCIRPPS